MSLARGSVPALLLVALAAVLTASEASIRDTNATALDDILEETLQRVMAAATNPAQLRAHIHQSMEKASPALRTSAAKCDLALASYIGGLLRRDLWALQMLDASSKLVTGLLYGNIADLGNFDECVTAAPGRRPADPPPDASAADGFTGRYVLPSLDVQVAAQAGGNRVALHRLLGAVPLPQDGARKEDDYSTKLSVRFAMCVPSTCEGPVVQQGLNAVLELGDGLLQKAGVRLRVRVGDRDTALAGIWRKMDAADWIVILLCAGLVLLVILGTTIDLTLSQTATQSRRRAAVLLAFSAYTNGKRLLTPSPPSDTNFTCINGIRFLSALWVILGHRYRFALDFPFTNLVIIPTRVEDVSVMAIAGAPLSVDTFFTIGGMVNCYSFMKATKGRRTYNWLLYYVHRYIRLTPAFAVMIGITATWLNLLATGPLWARVVAKDADTCNEYWWSSLLYVSNYVNPGYQCMIQSWYLMVDMQMHWLSPLLLLPLWKWGRVGLSWLMAVIVVSCAVPFAITYAYEFRTPISTDLNPEAQRFFMKTSYYPTHTRFTSYVCGVLAGYILYKIKTNQFKKWRLSQAQVLAGWTLSLGLMATVVFGAQPLFDTRNHPYNVWEASFYMGLYRAAWALGLSWVVIACIMNRGGPVNTFLSWGPFTVLGRLTYGIYLTHAAVQAVDIGTMRTPDYYSDFKMVKKMLSDAILATFFGAVLCLTAESPISAIEKILMKPRPRTRTKSPSAVANADVQGGVDNAGYVTESAAAAPALEEGKERQQVAVMARSASAAGSADTSEALQSVRATAPAMTPASDA